MKRDGWQTDCTELGGTDAEYGTGLLNSDVGTFDDSLLAAFLDEPNPVLIEYDISSEYPRSTNDVLGVILALHVLFRDDELEGEVCL